ncbi:MAG: hypothetical protein P8181_08890 [bacterium]
MIRTLLRQDPALRMLWLTLPASIAVALFTRVLLIDVPAGVNAGQNELRIMLLLGWINLWSLLLLVLFKSHFWVRCSRMSLALPLRPKTLWLTRMAAMIIAVSFPVALLAILLALRLPVDGTPLGLDTHWLGYGVQLGVGTSLALALWHLPSPRLHRAGSGRGYFSYALLVSITVFLFIRFVPVWSVYTLVALAAALAVGALVYVRLPESFALVNRDPEKNAGILFNTDTSTVAVSPHPVVAAEDMRPTPKNTTLEPAPVRPAAPRTEGRAVAASSSLPAGSTRSLVLRTTLRLAHNHWGAYLILGIICLYSFLLAHGYSNARNLGPYALFLLIWTWFTINQAIPRLRNIDPLPVSRRFLFAVAALPALTTAVVGVGLWELRMAVVPGGGSQVVFARGTVNVPPEFWEIAHEKNVPTIESPWGETHRPRTYRVLSDSDLVVYNPYSVGEENTPRFVALQIDRALEAVYGKPALPGGPAEHNMLESRLAAAMKQGESKVSPPVNAPAVNRLRVVLAGAVLFFLLAAAILFATMQGYRSVTFKPVYFGVVIGVLMLFVVSVVGAFFVDIWKITPPEVLDALPNVLLRKAVEKIPLGTTALWIAAVLTFAGCYLLIESRFEGAVLFAKRPCPITEEY